MSGKSRSGGNLKLILRWNAAMENFKWSGNRKTNIGREIYVKQDLKLYYDLRIKWKFTSENELTEVLFQSQKE